jgi:hypothetical protein
VENSDIESHSVAFVIAVIFLPSGNFLCRKAQKIVPAGNASISGKRPIGRNFMGSI